MPKAPVVLKYLNLLLLGGFDARLPTGQRLAIPSRKSQGLLAYLAVSPGRPHSRDVLAALLWERSGPEQARVSLRQSLAVLRKALSPLGTEILVSDREQVSLLAGTVEADSEVLAGFVAEGTPAAFERANSLYRGEFLEGCNLISEPFEEWLMGQRQRLRSLAEAAVEGLLIHYCSAGVKEHAIRAATRLAELDPLREDVQRKLMRLYAEAGRRAQALQQFEQFRETLRREVGSEPEHETRDLAAALLGQRTSRPKSGTAPAARLQSDEDAPGLLLDGPNGPPLEEKPLSAPQGSQPHAADTSGPTGISCSERRHLVLVFCGFADLHPLSSHQDPEVIQQGIESFRACCKRAVERFEGRVARVMGDGLLAYFGYPACEYSAERAVRAGLEIVSSIGVAHGSPGPRLHARVAIADGNVVIGNSCTDGARGEFDVTGSAVRLVSKLHHMVDLDQVVVAGNAKEALGRLFVCRDLGARKLPEFETPVRVWRVLRESAGPRRIEATRKSIELTPLVGRGEEVALLLSRWSLARGGAGQVVMLTGEAGIGKSRLIRVLKDMLTGERHVVISYYGSPYHQKRSLYPVIQQLEYAADLRRDDTPEIKLDRLEKLLAACTDEVAGIVPVLAPLLSIPTLGRYPSLALTASRRRVATLEVLENLLARLTKTQPVVLIFEDLHYMDPATRELLDRSVERVQTLPVMIVATRRPSHPPPWVFEPQVTNLVLRRLDLPTSRAMVGRVAHGEALSPELVTKIADTSDGIPLFIEEVTKAVLQTDRAQRAGRNQEPGEIAVASSLQDSLMARIDGLGPAKRLAQTASVLGRRFSYELLALVTGLDEEALSDALQRLIDAELIYGRGTGESATYTFKHCLVQEAAYSTLVRADRTELHRRVVRVLQARFADKVEREPEFIAYHCDGAGLNAEAVLYWQKAAEQALCRSAATEAASYLYKALDLLEESTDPTQDAEKELSIQTKLGQALILTKGYASHEVEAAYRRARELCDATGDAHQLFQILLGLWRTYISRQDLEHARYFGQQLLPVAHSENDTSFLLEAHVARSITSHAEGNFDEALAEATHAITLYDPQRHRGHEHLFGQDAGVISRIMAAWPLWCLGYPDQALLRMQEAQTLARDLGHPYSRAMADYCSAWLHQYRREANAVQENAGTAISLSTGQDFGWPLAFATILHGWALAEQERADVGITQIDDGLGALRSMGTRLWQPHLLALLGEAHTKAGRGGRALEILSEALETLDRTGEQEYAAELHRLKGALLGEADGSGADGEAEACFLRAIEIARGQNARSWELRAATSLGALWNRQGKKSQALELLLPIYGWFTEGFLTPDLIEARTLLASCGWENHS